MEDTIRTLPLTPEVLELTPDVLDEEGPMDGVLPWDPPDEEDWSIRYMARSERSNSRDGASLGSGRRSVSMYTDSGSPPSGSWSPMSDIQPSSE
jgi:hypothetical protein